MKRIRTVGIEVENYNKRENVEEERRVEHQAEKKRQVMLVAEKSKFIMHITISSHMSH